MLLLWVCHCWVWSSSLDLRVANNSCTLALPCFLLLRFRLHVLLFDFVSNICFGFGNDDLAFLYSFLYKVPSVLNIHVISPPLMLKNCSIMPTSSCFDCGPCENDKPCGACNLLGPDMPYRIYTNPLNIMIVASCVIMIAAVQ